MNKGFTMIELFVVITIIGILSSVVFLNWRHGEQLFALQNSAYKLCQDIKEAREMAMSAKVCTMCDDDIVPPRYGIYLHGEGSNFYQLFADINDDGMIRYPPQLSPPDKVIKTMEFEDGIYLDTVDYPIECSPHGPKKFHLSFAPPDPLTEIWIGVVNNPNLPVSCSKITLNLRIGTSGEIKSVIINQAGLVYVE